MVYVPGLTVGQLSGTAGNTVARANPFATTIGVKRSKRLAPTIYTQAQQAQYSLLSSRYFALDSGQREGWKALGATMPTTGRLARSYVLSARACFFSVNSTRLLALQSIIDDAPELFPVDPVEGLSVVAVAEPADDYSILVDFTPASPTLEEPCAIFATPPYSSARLALPTEGYRFIQLAQDPDDAPFDIAAAYLGRIGPWFVGQQIAVYVQKLLIDGFRAAPVYASAISS